MHYGKFLVGLSLAALSAQAGALTLQPVIGLENARISGVIQNNGDQVDLRNDLGLDKDNPAFAGLTLGAGAHQLSFRYTPYRFSGDSTPSKTFTFDGASFAVSDRLHTDLNLKAYSLDYRYRLFRTPVVQVGVGAGVTVLNGTVDITSQSTLNNTHQTFTAPIPTLGLSASAGLPLTGLSVGGDVSGISMGGNNHYVDAQAAVAFSPLPLAGIKVGYNYRELRVDANNTLGNIKLSGPYAALFAGF